MVEASAIEVTSDTRPSEKRDDIAGEAPSESKSYRCPTCDVLLWATGADFGDGIVFVRAGTLEENEKIVPGAHFFIRSKHPWIAIPDGVPTYDTLPSGSDGPVWSDETESRFEAARKKKE